jgi:F-type H+-transporting ATPase subunit b
MNVLRRASVLAASLLPIVGAAECLASEGGAHDDPNPLRINPDLAVFTAIIFLVLLVVLWKFAWGPIMEGLRKREDAIAEEIASAQRRNEEAKDLLEQYETRLGAAADEVRALLDQGRKDAETQRQQIIADAQEAARAEKERAVREIEVAKNEALGELAEKSVDTAVHLAGRIVGEQLQAADHARLIQEALENFPSQN